MKIFYILSLLCITCLANAQWNPDLSVNNLVCEGDAVKTDLTMLPDGEKGAFIFWTDLRNNSIIIGEGSGYDIYGQHVDSNGNALWNFEGLPICVVEKNQLIPKIVADDDGGVFLIWQDTRFNAPFDDSIMLFMQHVDADGNLLWGADGIPATSFKFSTPNSLYFQIVSDNAGGAIISFYGFSDDTDKTKKLLTSRINADGEFIWQETIMSSIPGNVDDIFLLADGTGGAVAGWDDYRDAEFAIAVQHVNASGEISWAENGNRITNLYNKESYPPVIAPDNTGGYFIAWSDVRNSVIQVFAQRLNADGEYQWAENGIAISSPDDYAFDYVMQSDLEGNAFITFTYGFPGNTLAQKINLDGTLLWGADPKDVFAPVTNTEQLPNIAADGFGGAVIYVTEIAVADKIKTIDINSDGSFNGDEVIVANGPGDAKIVNDFISATNNTWIYSWVEEREEDAFYVYASKIAFDVEIIDPPVQILNTDATSLVVYPNPFSNTIHIQSDISFHPISFALYDISGRKIYTSTAIENNILDLHFLPAGMYQLQVIYPDQINSVILQKL